MDLTTVAAVVQAVSAIAIVALTFILARVAGNSSKAAAASSDAAAKSADAAAVSAQAAVDQAKATAASYKEMRRQGQLAAVPLIDVRRANPVLSAAGVLTDTRVMLENVSRNVALDVQVSILLLDNQRQPQGAHARSIPLPMLAAAEQSERVLPSNEIRNVGRTVNPKPVEKQGPTGAMVKLEESYAAFGPYYANDWLLIRVECRSILGGIVTHEYEWNANYDHQDAFGVWSLLRVAIQPDPGDPSDIVQLRTT
jgi:hypothetical protein